jgi:hypothetical protein
MGATQIITHYCARPFKAEHPIGSGNIVEYKPGDVVPAGDWGPAANWLKESGKIFEGATVVYTDDEPVSSPSVEQLFVRDGSNDGSVPSGPPAFVQATEPTEPEFPQHIGFGSYKISTGESVKGLENALEAQAAINHPRYEAHVVTPDEDASQFDLDNFPISRPGGLYLLSNGETVSGRDHARELQSALTAEAGKKDEAVSVEGEFPKHQGAGYFELSDGSRVRGKAKAIAAEAALGGTDA